MNILNEVGMDLKTFNKIAGTIFGESLADYGFKLIRKKTAKLFCERIYVNGDWYVKIAATLHPRDYPQHYNIVLGQGSVEWPDCDWNSVALWRIKKAIDPKGKAQEYTLLEMDNDTLGQSLTHARKELLEYAHKFLTGDMELFEKVRQEQNKDRKPYKISPTDSRGPKAEADDVNGD